ncbi:MAG: alpha/beta fold hydrolase [Vicinamibacterales bacterium]
MPSSESTAPRARAHHAEPQVVDIAGLPTAYRREGDGAPLVYLHGGGLTRLWLPFLEALAAHHDVLAPQHPGFGATPLPDGFDGFGATSSCTTTASSTRLKLDRIHLVGHSLGGWIAADLAVYPRRFASLTLITPTGLLDAPLIDTFRMTPPQRRAALFNGRDAHHAQLFADEGATAELIQDFTEQATLARLTWNPRYDRKLDARLRRVRAPTLVIGAQDDRVVPTAMAARFAELIPGARLLTAPGAPGEPSGHVPHVEDPDRMAATVREHIEASA